MDPWRLSHLVVEHAAVILSSLWSLSTVKHGSFLFVYFLEKHLEICACPVAVCLCIL